MSLKETSVFKKMSPDKMLIREREKKKACWKKSYLKKKKESLEKISPWKKKQKCHPVSPQSSPLLSILPEKTFTRWEIYAVKMFLVK